MSNGVGRPKGRECPRRMAETTMTSAPGAILDASGSLWRMMSSAQFFPETGPGSRVYAEAHCAPHRQRMSGGQPRDTLGIEPFTATARLAREADRSRRDKLIPFRGKPEAALRAALTAGLARDRKTRARPVSATAHPRKRHKKRPGKPDLLDIVSTVAASTSVVSRRKRNSFIRLRTGCQQRSCRYDGPERFRS